MLFEEGQYPVIKHVCRGNSVFGGVEFGKGYTAVSIDNSLLINTAYAFHRSNIVSVLSHQVAGMLSFDLSEGFLLFFLSLQGDNLGFGEDQAFLGNTPFQGF